MKSVFTLIVSVIILGLANAQKTPTFKVQYLSKQKAKLDNAIKSQIGTVTYRDSNNVERTIQTPIKFDFSDFEFEAIGFIIANSESSKTYYAGTGNQTSGDVAIAINTPDTIYYNKGNWKSLSDGKYSKVPIQKIDVTETKETKKILGYDCIKFISKDGNIEFWASKSLPNTLLP